MLGGEKGPRDPKSQKFGNITFAIFTLINGQVRDFYCRDYYIQDYYIWGKVRGADDSLSIKTRKNDNELGSVL
jgi:hypothetical protein